MSNNLGYLYRCEESPIIQDLGLNGLKVEVYIRQFKILKKTTCGFWIEYWPYGKKLVFPKANKSYVRFTKAEAIQSFRARKRKQIQILKVQLQKAQLALEADELIDIEDSPTNQE